MAKGLNEKSIRISSKPAKTTAERSYVEGSKLTSTPKPKSLTPLKKKA